MDPPMHRLRTARRKAPPRLFWHSMGTMSSGTPASDERRSDWALPALLALILGVAAVLLIAWRLTQGRHETGPEGGATARSEHFTPAERPTGATVSLEIDFGNGARQTFDS